MINLEKLEGIHEKCFTNFCEFLLIFEKVASDSAVYTYLEREIRVNHTFVRCKDAGGFTSIKKYRVKKERGHYNIVVISLFIFFFFVLYVGVFRRLDRSHQKIHAYEDTTDIR